MNPIYGSREADQEYLEVLKKEVEDCEADLTQATHEIVEVQQAAQRHAITLQERRNKAARRYYEFKKEKHL